MKTIVVACGAGTVSSALMSSALNDLLRSSGQKAAVIFCRCDQLQRYRGQADLIVTSVSLPENLGVPVILGTPLITGQGSAQIEREILEQLAK